MLYVRIITTVLALSLFGCNNPKEASESNFKVAIQNYLDHQYPTCVFNREFPVKTNTLWGKEQLLDALVQEGLLTKTEETTPPANKYSRPTINALYNLSDKGKQVFTQKEGNQKSSLCFGRASLRELIDFTEPNNMFGQTVSEAHFTYSISDIPAWAKSPEVQKWLRLEHVNNSAEKPIKDKATLVLSNKGWVHHRMLGKASDEQ